MRNNFEILVCVLVVVGFLATMGGLWFGDLRVFVAGLIVGGLLPIFLASSVCNMKYQCYEEFSFF